MDTSLGALEASQIGSSIINSLIQGNAGNDGMEMNAGGSSNSSGRKISREGSFEMASPFPILPSSQGAVPSSLSLSQSSVGSSSLSSSQQMASLAVTSPTPTSTEPPSFWSCCIVPSKVKTIQLQKRQIELHITNIALQCSLPKVKSVSLRVFTNRVRQGCLVCVLRPGRVEQLRTDLTFFPTDKYVRLALEGVEGLDGVIDNPNVVSLHLSGVVSSYELLSDIGSKAQGPNLRSSNKSNSSLSSTSMNPVPLHGDISGSDSDSAVHHSELSEIGNNNFENDIMSAVAGSSSEWDPITHSPKQNAKQSSRSPPNISAEMHFGTKFPAEDYGSDGGTRGSNSSRKNTRDSGRNDSVPQGGDGDSGRKGDKKDHQSGSLAGADRGVTSNGKSSSGSNQKKKQSPHKKRSIDTDDNGRKSKRPKSTSTSPKSKSSSPTQHKSDTSNESRSAQNQAAFIIAGAISESSMRGSKWRSATNGLKFRDTVYGQGTEAKAGSKIKVRYTGRLCNSEGKMFDQNLKKGMKFTLGLGKVIQGWDFGLLGVRAGGIRQLLIPSKMAYGRQGVPGKIPSNTPLWFEVQISSVR